MTPTAQASRGYPTVWTLLERATAAKWFLQVVLMLCIGRLWLMPLPSSFWVDEMATSFVVEHGAANPSLMVAPQVGASVYYALPRAAVRWLGSSEIAYRLPSVLAMVLGLWLIGRIAARLIHPGAAWFAVFSCLAIRDFNYQAADARPYALGTCVLCATLWFLVRWLDSARWLDALLFFAGASLLWRVHLIFWPFYILFAIYAAVRLAGNTTAVSRTAAAAIFTAVAVSLLPVLNTALAIYREAGSHVVVRAPTAEDLTASLKLALIAPMCAGAAVIGRWRRWPRVEAPISAAAFCLILGWWLCDPLCLFLFSRLTGNSVFVSRYLYLALPGAALTGATAAALFIPTEYWKPLAAALGLAILLFMGRWSHFWPAHHNSDWRAAATSLNAQSLDSGVPVVCPSPFIEARPPAWRPDYPVSSFLYSHLLPYRIRGKEYPFPFESSPEAEQFAARLSRDTFPAAHEFVLYGGDHVVRFWRNWFHARPELAGWRTRELGPFGDVDVVIFFE